MLSRCAVLMCALSGNAVAECQLQRLAEIPVTLSGTRPQVSGSINGKQTRFLLDTGAEFSLLSRTAAARLGVKTYPMPFGVGFAGIGGEAKADLGRADEFTLDGFAGATRRFEFVVLNLALDGSMDGLIGQNILAKGDTEFDFAHGVMRIFKPKDCQGHWLAYWSAENVGELHIDEAALPLRLASDAKLNGTRIALTLDTGAAYSLLSSRAAARAGINPDSPSVTAAGWAAGVGPKTVETFIARFDSLEIGGERINNSRLRFAKADLPAGDMLLGADFFLSHRSSLPEVSTRFISPTTAGRCSI